MFVTDGGGYSEYDLAEFYPTEGSEPVALDDPLAGPQLGFNCASRRSTRSGTASNALTIQSRSLQVVENVGGSVLHVNCCSQCRMRDISTRRGVLIELHLAGELERTRAAFNAAKTNFNTAMSRLCSGPHGDVNAKSIGDSFTSA